MIQSCVEPAIQSLDDAYLHSTKDAAVLDLLISLTDFMSFKQQMLAVKACTEQIRCTTFAFLLGRRQEMLACPCRGRLHNFIWMKMRKA